MAVIGAAGGIGESPNPTTKEPPNAGSDLALRHRSGNPEDCCCRS